MTGHRPLKVALFGAGRIGSVHASNITSHGSLELVWICDPFLDGARRLANRSNARATASVEEVFADESIDAVVIGSPTDTHIELIAQARAHGKAALCEKPIDLDIRRVKEYLDAADDRDGAPVMLGFNRRFDPSFAAVRARVEAGEIGELEQLVITSRDPQPAPDDYVASSGGIFRDMTIHDLDMARSFIPRIVEISAVGSNVFSGFIREIGDYDSVVVTLRGDRDELVTIINSRHCAFGYDQRLEAFGSEGMLTASNVTPTAVRSYTRTSTGASETFLPFFLERYADSYREELNAFVAAILGDAPCVPGLDDGVQALVLADAALESAQTHRTVTLAR